MSSIFTRLGAAVRTVLGTNPEPEDKLELIANLEELRDSATALLSVLDTPVFLAAAEAEQKKSGSAFGKIYHLYFAKLSSRAASVERQGILKAYLQGVQLVLSDLNGLLQHNADLFGSPRDPDLKFEDLRVSTAAALGFTENAYDYIKWGTYLVMILSSEINTPPYMLTWALDKTEQNALFTSVLLGRATSFVDSLLKLRNRGKDSALSTDGVTVDQYARETDYEPVVVSSLAGFVRLPFVSAGEHRIVAMRRKMDSLKSIQSWLQTKRSLIQLDMAKLDEHSPEYARLSRISEGYLKELTVVDKKLAAYA